MSPFQNSKHFTIGHEETHESSLLSNETVTYNRQKTSSTTEYTTNTIEEDEVLVLATDDGFSSSFTSKKRPFSVVSPDVVDNNELRTGLVDHDALPTYHLVQETTSSSFPLWASGGKSWVNNVVSDMPKFHAEWTRMEEIIEGTTDEHEPEVLVPAFLFRQWWLNAK